MNPHLSRTLSMLLIGSVSLGVMATGATASGAGRINNIVLVHGAFVDGSGWEAVHRLLVDKGYQVRVVQHTTASLATDVAATKAVVDAQDGPVILVGHSYGGVVITEAGNHPKVSRLVYVAAFVPDAGESVQKLIANPSPDASPPPIVPNADGSLLLDPAKFGAAFGQDLPAQRVAFLAHSQLPWGGAAVGGEVTTASWKTKPSWYLVAGEDRMIPPAAQRAMSQRAKATVSEVRSSHAVYESRPEVVASIIEAAAAQR